MKNLIPFLLLTACAPSSPPHGVRAINPSAKINTEAKPKPKKPGPQLTCDDTLVGTIRGVEIYRCKYDGFNCLIVPGTGLHCYEADPE